MLANQWKNNAFAVMNKIEETQMEKIKEVATIMADAIEAGRWVHTFGCGHANLPIEEMYPRIGGFVGFHPLCELPLTFFTHIVGEMGYRFEKARHNECCRKEDAAHCGNAHKPNSISQGQSHSLLL